MTSLDLVVMGDMPATPTEWTLPSEWEPFTEDFVTLDEADDAAASNSNKVSKSRQSAGSACEECRRRKSGCNRKQPTCGACATAGTTCVFRKTCPPRGPKRGHLRALRDKIQALENRLSEQENQKASTTGIDIRPASEHSTSSLLNGANDTSSAIMISPQDHSTTNSTDGSIVMSSMTPFLSEQPLWFAPHPATAAPVHTPIPPALLQMGNNGMNSMSHPSMTSILDLASADSNLSPLVRTDLDQLFFGRVYVFAPMIQKFRYVSWASAQQKGTQQQCLQFTMWALSSLLSTQFLSIRDSIYREARTRLDLLETDSSVNGKRYIDQVQAWILLSLYEFLGDQQQRALVSSGRALRLAQILKLDDLDSSPSKSASSPGEMAARDGAAAYAWTGACENNVSPAAMTWVTTESMRRTFWIAYILDCFTAVHEGLSVSFGEQHIRTRLPAPNCKFVHAKPFLMPYLSEVMDTSDGKVGEDATAGTNSPLVRIIVIATMCSRVLYHKQRADHEQSGTRSTDDFLRRDSALTALLAVRLESLSAEVAASIDHPDPLLIFAAMGIHMIALILYDITKTMFMNDKKMHALLMKHKDRASKSIQKLAELAEVASRLNPFEVHLLSPIPLMVGARYCIANMSNGDAFTPPLDSIKKALRVLQSVNSLARQCLQVLG